MSQIAKRPICFSDATEALSSLRSLTSSGEREDTDRGRDLNKDDVCVCVCVRYYGRDQKENKEKEEGKEKKTEKLKPEREKQCGNLLTQAALCPREQGQGGCYLCVCVCEVTLTLMGVTCDNQKCLDAHTCFPSAAGVANIKMISAQADCSA